MKNSVKNFNKKVTPRTIKICLAIPCMGTVRIETLLSVVGMLTTTNNAVFYVAYRTGCYIEQNRTELIKTAVRENCDKLFFLDSDIMVESNVINKLLSHNKPVIGAAYNNRSFPLYSNVKIADETGKRIAVPELPKEVFKTAGMPTGCLLVDIPTVLKVPEPWFDLEYHEDGSLKTGEDIYFCDRLIENGIDIWCDPTIQVGHVGTYVY